MPPSSVPQRPPKPPIGERAHLISFLPTLRTFIEDIVQVLRYEDLHDVILVGHGLAGAVISSVADRMSERLHHLVFLGVMVVEAGEGPTDRTPLGRIDR